MKEKPTVKFSIDLRHPPALSAVQRRRLAALARLPDAKIDYSDDAASSNKMKWTRPGLHPAALVASGKQQITLRLDTDVLAFFRNTGTKYQSRINAVLREYAQAHQATS